MDESVVNGYILDKWTNKIKNHREETTKWMYPFPHLLSLLYSMSYGLQDLTKSCWHFSHVYIHDGFSDLLCSTSLLRVNM